MEKTPQSGRLHVTIFGETNTGKSALFNAITDTRTVIVSDISGTTTDPVSKSMELLPYGPIVLTDTAGLKDAGILGIERLKKTESLLERTDYAIYTVDINNFDENTLQNLVRKFKEKNIPYSIVFTKKDLIEKEKLYQSLKSFPNAMALSVLDQESVEKLKIRLAHELQNLGPKEKDLIAGLLPPKSVVLMVVPIDSEAPKGRLILPQAQLIRSCLDNQIRVHVSTLIDLKFALEDLQKIDLVVTDSQIFREVAEILPQDMLLTSFSILMARQKSDINIMMDGIKAIKELQNNDKILIAESCVHSRGHEDIGRIKIPALLQKMTGKELEFVFITGRDFPETLEQYKLIIHCGGCMMTVREMQSRIKKAKDNNVPITNYGMFLAYGSGILERGTKILACFKIG